MRTPRRRIAFARFLLTLAVISLRTTPAFAISSRTFIAPLGAAAGDNFGFSVSGAGDVNGDGYDDVIVGAWGNDAGGADAGRAYVYFGGPAADAVPGLTLTGELFGDQFGVTVSGAGDVNGDGYADLIVGASWNDAGGVDAGRAYVFYGGPAMDDVPDLTLTGAAAGDHFGQSVSGAGDVNGDGYADVIVGATGNDAGGADAGRAYVFYGGPAADTVADLTVTGAAAGDGLGNSVSGAGDVNGDGYADVIVGASGNDAGGADAGRAYAFYGGPGIDTTADLVLTGGLAGDQFGADVSGAGDMNGDGYGDLIVGANLNDAGGLNSGQAYVFHGGQATDAFADLILTGAAPGDWFGASVSAAGDLNGDGYADVIVGASFNDASGPDAGRAYVFYGGPGADPLADLTLIGTVAFESFGVSVSGAGDVDGDGHDDVIVGAYLNSAAGANAGRAYVTSFYPYRVLSPNGGEQWVAGKPAAVRWLGHDVADVSISLDGGLSWSALAGGVGGAADNQIEVVAPVVATNGARIRVTSTGQAATHATSDASDGVFRIVIPRTPPGVASRLGLAPIGAGAADLFGGSVSGAGDVNGDGYADVIVGASRNDAGAANAGRAYVYFGGPGGDLVADLTFTGLATGDFFGISVSGAGDVNGDGYSDLVVGAPNNDAAGIDAGAAYVYYGGPGADAVADLTLTGAGAGDNFGFSVSGAGDVNRDGYADVIVGAFANDAGGPDAGRAYVYFGGPGADATADLTLTGEASGNFFGYSVADAGDVNGDLFADVIVGAFQNGAGGAFAGRAYVFLGGAVPNATADLTLTGAAVGDQLGYSVSAAGDVNDDGYGDVIVGAYANDAGGADAGRAYVFFGGLAADAVADLMLTGAAPGDAFGYSVSGAGDVNGDGSADVIVSARSNDAGGADAGRAYVYFGGAGADAVADLILTGQSASDSFGESVSGAGDVNGDGFDDLVVGAANNDAGGSNAGRAYFYDANRYFVLTPNDDEVWNVGASQTVSWLGTEKADLWLSVDGGRSYDLLRHDVGGNASNSVGLLVPHAPTKFARVKVTPADPSITGADESDSLFTIQSSVALLNLVATLGDGGAELSWSSEPAVGPQGLAGYRVYRVTEGGSSNGVRIGPELITETHYTDAAGTAGTTYRLTAVNGLQQELELGRVSLALQSPLAAWPLPYRGGPMSVSFGVYGLGSGPGEATVELFDLGGRRVRTLARGRFASGFHAVKWDGLDDRGDVVRNGVYFLRATSAGLSRQLKVAVVR